MKTSTLRSAALATTLGLSILAPPAASASAGGGSSSDLAMQIGVKILDKALGFGVGEVLTLLLGSNQGSAATNLSQQAFDRIAGIVNESFQNQDFQDAKDDAATALNSARDYAPTLAGPGVSADNATALTVLGIESILSDGREAESALVSVGLRGLPLYAMVQSTMLVARLELRDVKGPANEATNEGLSNGLARRTLMHFDAMQDEYTRLNREAYPLRKEVRDFYGLQDQQYCFDGPLRTACGGWSAPAFYGTSEWYAEQQKSTEWALLVRRRQFAEAYPDVFGDIGGLRYAVGQKGFLADGFGNTFTSSPAETWPVLAFAGGGLTALAGDVDGDGQEDLVLHSAVATVGLGNGQSFTFDGSFDASAMAFTVLGVGEPGAHSLGDVDGDGLADLVSIAADGVYVGRSTGTAFTAPARWLEDCSADHGWNAQATVRTLGDVDGDGMADMVCIGESAVYVGFSTGHGFLPMVVAGQHMTLNGGGWRVDRHPRMLADVNGDGRADLVGFGETQVFVALSEGTTFGPLIANDVSLTIGSGGWQVDRHPRMMADVNGDGLADVVGFGDTQVFVRLSTGDGRLVDGGTWAQGYGTGAGYSLATLRALVDVDGDGDADLVAQRFNPVAIEPMAIEYATR